FEVAIHLGLTGELLGSVTVLHTDTLARLRLKASRAIESKGAPELLQQIRFLCDGKPLPPSGTVERLGLCSGSVLEAVRVSLLAATASEDGKARLWSLASGSCVQVLEDDSKVTTLAFSPDGKQLVTGSSDGAVGESQFTQRLSQRAVFSPDGGTLATACQNSVAPLVKLLGHSDAVAGVDAGWLFAKGYRHGQARGGCTEGRRMTLRTACSPSVNWWRDTQSAGCLNAQSSLHLKDPGLADLLLKSGSAAAVVVDGSGKFQDLITDILRCLWHGVPQNCTVGEWLQGRSSSDLLWNTRRFRESLSDPKVIVPPELPLHGAVVQLQHLPSVSHGFGHLLVCDGKDFVGVLSLLHVASAIAESGWEAIAEVLGVQKTATATVSEFMEPLHQVPFCMPGSTMQQLVQAEVLVADEQGVHGLATAHDACGFQGAALPKQSGRMANDVWQARVPRPQTARHLVRKQQLPWLLLEAAGRPLRHLVAVKPGGTAVVGVLSPVDLLRGIHLATQSGLPPSEASMPSLSPPLAQEAGLEEQRRQPPTPPRPSFSPSRLSMCRSHPVTVAEVLERRRGPEVLTCCTNEVLADACDSMLSAGRTAALVLDPATARQGSAVRGVLTENDVLQALVDNAPGHLSIAQWIRGFQEAARKMSLLGSFLLLPQSQIQSRAIVPTCQLSDNLTDAFRMLLDKRQNCAVVVSGGSCMELESNTEHPQNRVTAASAATAEKQAKGSQEESVIDDLSPVYGIITTADALRAFLEYHTGVRSNLASCLVLLRLRRPDLVAVSEHQTCLVDII
ncbi:unnamed protein product, partial [Polarella glacialis]